MNSQIVSFSSSTNLIPHKPKQKDYQGAFASLQSQYGANGMAPVQPVPQSQSSKLSSKVKAPQALQNAASSHPKSYSSSYSSSGSKDWEGALANLQSSYGFSGAAPALRGFSSYSQKRSSN
jgi:hypothetical protein